MNINLQEELSKGAEHLYKAGISHARLEAELILSKILHVSREGLYQKDEMEITEKDYAKFFSELSERKKRVPIAYLLEKKEFMSLEFFVDRRVLIPRPETELIVEKVVLITETKKDFTWKIIDLGTGSGNLAISLAYYLPESRVWAADISKGALQIAEMNAWQHKVNEKIEFLCGNWFAPLTSEGLEGKIDFIVANPPYLSSDEMNTLPEDVKYEPKIALDGGEDGLKFYKEIIEGSSRYLKAGGYLILEMGIRHKEKIFELINVIGRYDVPEVTKDYSGFDRIVVVQKTV